jgi:hypothetical protein
LQDDNSETSFIIDLPGVPVTGSIDDLRDESESISDAEDEASPAKKSRPEISATKPGLKISLTKSGPEISLTKTTDMAPSPKKARGPIVDDPFYGFLPSEVPKRTIIFPDDDTAVDLTTPFNEELLFFGGDLTPEDLLTGQSESVKVKRPSIVVPLSSIVTSPKPVPEPTKATPAVNTLQSPGPKPARTSAALPTPMVRESREWKPSAQFFKPLTAGQLKLFYLHSTKNYEFLLNQSADKGR